MAYTVTEYKVACRDCEYQESTESLVQAVETADRHVDKKYGHSVEISTVTVVRGIR